MRYRRKTWCHSYRWWRQERGLDRLALHCLSIALPDPAETIVAPLEGSLADVLRAELYA